MASICTSHPLHGTDGHCACDARCKTLVFAFCALFTANYPRKIENAQSLIPSPNTAVPRAPPPPHRSKSQIVPIAFCELESERVIRIFRWLVTFDFAWVIFHR